MLGKVAVPRLLDGLQCFGTAWGWLAACLVTILCTAITIWTSYDIAWRDGMPNIEVLRTGFGVVNDKNTRDIRDIAIWFTNKGKRKATDIVIRIGTFDQPKQVVKLLAEKTLPYLEAANESKEADLKNHAALSRFIVSCISYHDGSDVKQSPAVVYPVPDDLFLLLQRGQWVPLKRVFNEAEVLVPGFSCEQMRAE